MKIVYQISFITFIISIIVSGAFSETLQDTSFEIKDNPNDLQLSMQNVMALTEEPFHLTWKQWLISSGVIGGMVLSFLLDQKLYSYTKSHTLLKGKDFIDKWQIYGSPYMLVVGGGIYIAGIGFSMPSVRETGREALTAMITAEAITLTLKIIFGRLPPSENNSPADFSFFEFHQRAWSFPSGHTTIAFSLSTVLSERIENPYITLVLYTTASLVGVERVYNNKHWLSDVIMGAAIGTAVGRIVVKSSTTIEKTEQNWELLPHVSSNEIGFKFNYLLKVPP